MVIPIFFLAHWYGSLLAQTIFLHRYAAHRMYSLNKFWEKVFFLSTYIFQGSSFLNPRAYAILHRLHHAHSDTPEDPHSPVIYPNVMTMMLHTKNKYLDILDNKLQVTKEHLANIPRWHWLEGFAEKPWSRLGWAAGYITFYVFFAEAWYWYLLLPIHFLMGPIHGAIVNWAGHKIGYQNFDNKDNSRNTLAFDFLTLGELFQNNHHKFPGRSNFAKRWWEVDPGYWLMRALHGLGIIKMKKQPKRSLHVAREKAKQMKALAKAAQLTAVATPERVKELA
jgi:stearoyl-CoA desaturase (Delta-9 desaturase)